jgi:hypothetical protein
MEYSETPLLRFVVLNLNFKDGVNYFEDKVAKTSYAIILTISNSPKKNLLKFPYGLRNFYDLITENYFYVDRTCHIRARRLD